MSQLEDRELIRSTANLIKYSGRYIVLHRPPAPEDDGAGGRRAATGPDTALPPQQVFCQGSVPMHVTVQAAEGEQDRSDYVLVGMSVAAQGLQIFDVKQGDWFVVGVQKYEVGSVHHDKGYQMKANCSVVY